MNHSLVSIDRFKDSTMLREKGSRKSNNEMGLDSVNSVNE